MKKIFTGIGILIFFWASVLALAETEAEINNAIYEARNGIFQVNLAYVDESSENHVVQGGSGFLIGNEEGADYIITNYHSLDITDELRSTILAQFGLGEDKRNSLNFVIQVVVKRDIVIEASVVTKSEEMDFAVLELQQPVYDRVPMALNVDIDSVLETAPVYTLGFPEEIQQAQDISYYTKEDVSVINGIVSKKASINGIQYIQHSAVVSAGNSGGPLVNEAGQVIGMNQVILNDGYYYSVHISEITSILDALGIPYTKAEQKPLADTSVLDATVSAANEKDMDNYTKESAEEFQTVVREAENLLQKEEFSQEEIDAAIQKIRDAENVLVIKSGMNYMLIGGIGILLILVVLIVILIIVVRKSEKDVTDKKQKPKKEKKPDKEIRTPVYEKPSPSGSLGGQSVLGETSVLQPVSQVNVGETTVLDGQTGATSVTANLVRSKTNEKIVINKMIFYLGKDGLKADYCIKDNPSISRNHAAIKQMNGGFYLEDLQATNGTYLNGVRLQPSQSVKLNNGDRIRLANDEFKFSL